MRCHPSLVFVLLLASCRDQPKTTLTVAAAASLHEVIVELDSLYQAEHPDVAVRATFGASGPTRRHGALGFQPPRKSW